MVPDGVAPAQLRELLVGVGVRAGEATEAVAGVIAETCDAVQWASLTRARETAAQYEGLGIYLPELLGGAGDRTAACLACGEEARYLFHLRGGTPEGDRVVDAVNARVCEAAARRVSQTRGQQTRNAVKMAHDERGVHVCVACAAPRMAVIRVRRFGFA